jgi:hypothetical protein
VAVFGIEPEVFVVSFSGTIGPIREMQGDLLFPIPPDSMSGFFVRQGCESYWTRDETPPDTLNIVQGGTRLLVTPHSFFPAAPPKE